VKSSKATPETTEAAIRESPAAESSGPASGVEGTPAVIPEPAGERLTVE
jgi:hypothetical protein